MVHVKSDKQTVVSEATNEFQNVSSLIFLVLLNVINKFHKNHLLVENHWSKLLYIERKHHGINEVFETGDALCFNKIVLVKR